MSKLAESQRKSPLSLEKQFHKGWLWKQGGTHKRWQRRWCVLSSTDMYYYASQMDPEPRGVIDLKGRRIYRADTETKRDNTFGVETPGRTFYFSTDEEPDVMQWMDKIAQALRTEEVDKSSKDVDKIVEETKASGGYIMEGLSKMTTKPLSEEEKREQEEKRRKEEKDRLEREKKLAKEREERRERYRKEKTEIEEREQQERLAFMKRGSLLLKFAFGRGKPHYRYVVLSQDSKELKWGSRKDKYDKTHPLTAIKWLVFGARTRTFHKHAAILDARAKWRCFSIVLGDRTVDFQCDTPEMCDNWYLGLQGILKNKIVAENRQLLSKAHIRFKRLKQILTSKAQARNRTFGQVVMEAVKKSIPDERRNEFEIKLFFDAFDKNQNGQLDKQEMMEFFRALNEDVDEKKFNQVFKELDLDSSGQLTFGEFFQVASRMFDLNDLAMVAKVRNVFIRYDRDKSGFIDAAEVRAVFKQCEGRDMPQAALEAFMNTVDTNKDGVISWGEFLSHAIKNFAGFEEYHRKAGTL